VLAGVASGAGVDFAHAPSAFAVVLTMAITAEAAKPKRDGEDEEYFDFYLACCMLVLVIELCGGGCSCLDAVQCVQLSGQVEARAVERGVACGDEKDCNGKWRIGPLLCYRGKGGQAT